MPAKQATSRRVDRSRSRDGQTTFADAMGPEPMFPTAHLQRVSNPPRMTVRAFAARPQGTVRPPVRWPPLDVCETHTPWTLGQWSLRIGYVNRQTSATPQRRATQASSQQPCTKREWCPASLVVPVALRREGRTETLTRPLHTMHKPQPPLTRGKANGSMNSF
jgi:hypothetical protein